MLANLAPMPQMERLGDAFELLRQRSGLSKVELGARSGLSQSVINRAVKGKTSPNADTMAAILDALGMTMHDLADALDEVNGRDMKQARLEKIVGGLNVRAEPERGERFIQEARAELNRALGRLEMLEQLYLDGGAGEGERGAVRDEATGRKRTPT